MQIPPVYSSPLCRGCCKLNEKSVREKRIDEMGALMYSLIRYVQIYF